MKMQLVPQPPARKPTDRIPLPGAGDGEWPGSLATLSRRAGRLVRAIRRTLLMLLATLVAAPVQALLILLPGRGKVLLPRIYWRTMSSAIGLRVQVIGQPATKTEAAGRPVVFASTHCSWLDVAVLGGRLDACFIAKTEVSKWPVLSIVARLGRTVFVQRRRGSTLRERDDMVARLAAGDSLILFPEGTTSDGSRVLPFRSAFFSIAEKPATADGAPPWVQPVSLTYDRLGFLPTGRASRALFAWYGDMGIAPHYWRLAQHGGLRATMVLHEPLDPRDFPSRKALAEAVWKIAADGAATLRQGRPAAAIAAPRSASREAARAAAPVLA